MESVQTELNLNGLVFPKKEIELTELEKRVFNLIPVGKENAKTGAYIADTLDISLRHVTGLVKKLRLNIVILVAPHTKAIIVSKTMLNIKNTCIDLKQSKKAETKLLMLCVLPKWQKK